MQLRRTEPSRPASSLLGSLWRATCAILPRLSAIQSPRRIIEVRPVNYRIRYCRYCICSKITGINREHLQMREVHLKCQYSSEKQAD